MTHDTSGPRRARSDPRRAVLTTRCADRMRNLVPVGPWGRSRAARHPASPTAVGREPPRGGAVKSVRPGARGSGAGRRRLGDEGNAVHLRATPRRMTVIESEAAARKRRFAELSMSPVGRELPVIAALNSTAASRNSGFPRSTPSSRWSSRKAAVQTLRLSERRRAELTAEGPPRIEVMFQFSSAPTAQSLCCADWGVCTEHLPTSQPNASPQRHRQMDCDSNRARAYRSGLSSTRQQDSGSETYPSGPTAARDSLGQSC